MVHVFVYYLHETKVQTFSFHDTIRMKRSTNDFTGFYVLMMLPVSKLKSEIHELEVTLRVFGVGRRTPPAKAKS